MMVSGIGKEIHVRAVDLAGLLRTNETEITRLGRSQVLRRVPKGRQGRNYFVYPCFESVGRYTEFHRSGRERVHNDFLAAKAGREKAQQERVERENRVAAAELVNKEELFTRLEPIIVACREQILARADRLEREIALAKDRKAKVAVIRAADLEALKVLHDLFVAGSHETKGTKTGVSQ
jgi:hypothetical protein